MVRGGGRNYPARSPTRAGRGRQKGSPFRSSPRTGRRGGTSGRLVIRQPEFQAFAPQLRYLRGRSSGAVLQSLLGDASVVSPLDAALFSSFLSGLRRAVVGKSIEETRVYARQIADSLLRALRGG